MSVKIKEASVKDEKGTPINFNAEDHMAVKGTDKSFFPNIIKVVHKEQGKKLLKNKLVTEEKVTLVKEQNLNRAVKDKSSN